jgi:hypothetical protein
MQKRLAKLEAKHASELQALEAKVAELEGKANGARPSAAPAAGGYDPVDAQPAVAELRQNEANIQRGIGSIRTMVRDLETAPEKVIGFLQSKGLAIGDGDVEAAQAVLATHLAQSEEALSVNRSELAVERRAARQHVASVKQEAARIAGEKFPWVADKKDPRHAIAANTLKEIGPFANHPSAPLFANVWADFVHGLNTAKPATTKPAVPGPKATLPRRTAATPPPARKGESASGSETNQGNGTATNRGARSYFDTVAADVLQQHARTR